MKLVHLHMSGGAEKLILDVTTSPNITIEAYAAYIQHYGLSWRFHGFGAVFPLPSALIPVKVDLLCVV